MLAREVAYRGSLTRQRLGTIAAVGLAAWHFAAGVASSQPATHELLAAPPGEAVRTPYVLHHWSRDDGMPQNSANAAIQTRDGYIWLATLGGVVRFDGLNFTTFDMGTTTGLLDNRAQVLFEDRTGNLWIGHDLAGVSVYRDGRFHAYTSDDGLPAARVNAIVEDLSGTIWIGTSRGLARRVDDGFVVFTTEDGLPYDGVGALRPSSDGSLWVGTTHGLVRFEDERFTPVDGAPRSPVHAILETGDVLWVGTSTGLYRGEAGSFAAQSLPFPVATTGTRTGVRALALDREGHLWVAVPGDAPRLYRFAPDEAGAEGSSFDLDSGHSLEWVAFTIFEDREGSLWLGGRGLTRLGKRNVFRFSVESGLPGETRAVTSDGEGGLWVGATCPRPLSRLRDGRAETVTHSRDGRPLGCATALLSEGRTLWLGGEGTLVRYEDEQQQRFELPGAAAGDVILAIARERDGPLWVGTRRRGLVRFENETARLYTTKDGLASEEIRFLMHSDTGSLWIGTVGGLSRFDGERFVNFDVEDGLPPGMVRAIHEDDDGVLWIGTYGGGLARFEHDVFTRYTTANGLFDNVVSRILEDDRGNLWMLGNQGLFYTSRAELNDVASGRSERIQCVSFDRTEGMIEGQGGAQPAGWRADDGRMWWTTIDGLAMVDAASFRANELGAPAAIERVLINHEEASLAPNVELPPGMRELEVHYTGLSLIAPHKVRFRYMLEGFESDWVHVANRRIALYTNVPPGSYRFRVQASNNDGVWGDTEAALAVLVPPRLYERTSVRIAIFSVMLGLAFVVFRKSVRGVQARNRRLQQQIEEVNARIQAEAGLRESEARYRSLTDNAPFGIFEIDFNGILLSMNETGAALLGAGRDDVSGIDYLHLMPDTRGGVVEARFERARAGSATTFETQVGFGDEVRTLSHGLYPVFDGNGVVVKLIGVVVDISDRRRTEAALRRSEEQLRQAQKMEAIGLLAGGVAHDFNNILTVIGGYSELLLSTSLEDSQETRIGLQEIFEASSRAASLTRQLLAFSRRQVLKPEVIDVGSVLAKMETILERIIGEDIELRRADKTNDARIEADPGQISQVIMNLAINARDAMPDGGTLTLGVQDIEVTEEMARSRRGLKPGRYALVTVEDTGVGIPEDQRSRVFEPFFTTKERGRGTGLGLSTVYGIVKQSQGYIDVWSESGRGTRFEVYLPRVEAELTISEEPGAETPSGTATILLAEDDTEVRALVRAILTSHGYTVLDAMSGDDALAMVDGDAERIDLLMTDVIMPRMKGDELAKRLSHRNPDLKILFLSGYTGESVPSFDPSALKADLLEKPFTSGDLLAKVAQVLSRP